MCIKLFCVILGICVQAGEHYKKHNRAKKYYWVDNTGVKRDEERTCPTGYVWSQAACACLIVVAAPVCTDEDDLIMYLSFDNDFNDDSCTQSINTQTGKPSSMMSHVPNP